MFSEMTNTKLFQQILSGKIKGTVWIGKKDVMASKCWPMTELNAKELMHATEVTSTK